MTIETKHWLDGDAPMITHHVKGDDVDFQLTVCADEGLRPKEFQLHGLWNEDELIDAIQQIVGDSDVMIAPGSGKVSVLYSR